MKFNHLLICGDLIKFDDPISEGSPLQTFYCSLENTYVQLWMGRAIRMGDSSNAVGKAFDRPKLESKAAKGACVQSAAKACQIYALYVICSGPSKVGWSTVLTELLIKVAVLLIGVWLTTKWFLRRLNDMFHLMKVVHLLTLWESTPESRIKQWRGQNLQDVRK